MYVPQQSVITNTDSFNLTKIISRHGFAELRFSTETNHHSLHAITAFKTGEIIHPFSAATTQKFATYLTIQTGPETHITFAPEFLQYINPGCDPNVFFDTTTMQLICVKPVQAGDELCFFYPSAEWKMAQPFICNCGSNNCLKFIAGAAYLTHETLEPYRLTDFISQQIKLIH